MCSAISNHIFHSKSSKTLKNPTKHRKNTPENHINPENVEKNPQNLKKKISKKNLQNILHTWFRVIFPSQFGTYYYFQVALGYNRFIYGGVWVSGLKRANFIRDRSKFMAHQCRVYRSGGGRWISTYIIIMAFFIVH